MASPQKLNTKAVIQVGIRNVVGLLLMTGGTLFLAAGRIDWAQPWILMALYAVFFSIWIPWGLRNSPELILERARSLEKQSESWDKPILLLSFLAGIALYAVAGLDAIRFGWSHVAPWLQWLGFLLVAPSYFTSLWALMNNPYASGVVRLQAERGQQVVDRGPYQIVRHPMYAGTFFFDLGLPLFLGTFWALIRQ